MPRASRPVRTAVIIAGTVALVTAAAARLQRARALDGTTTRQLTVGGVSRTYLLHAAGDARTARPLIIVLHGWRGSAVGIERRTRGTFDKLADRDGAVVVYPEALGDPRWNDGWTTGGASVPDDLAFLSALIDTLAADHHIDRKRVYAAGFSNGASMAFRLACERPDLVAAVAPISGTMSAPVASACPHGPPVGVITMHGTDDPLVPFDDHQQHDLQTWLKRDGCPARPSSSSSLPDTAADDGTTTHVDLYAPCAAGTAVAFYTIEGGGHAWPSGDTGWSLSRHGKTARDFDAAAVIWEFFQRYGRRAGAVTD